MNKVFMKKSIYTLVIALPLITTSAFAYPAGGCPAMQNNCPPQRYGSSMYMSAPVLSEAYMPVSNANKKLFAAMETGDIKMIQQEANNVIKTIDALKDQDLKKSLSNGVRFLTFMTKSTSYKEMRTAYRTVLQNLAPRVAHRRNGGMPSLYVDSQTYQTLQDAELVYNQLEESLYNGSESTVDTRIKSLITLLKNIKNPALADYIAATNVSLNNMYKEKTIVAKLQELRSVRLTIAPLFWITAEKVS